MKLKFAKVFKPVLSTEALEIDLFSGRCGGKSFVAADMAILYSKKFPHHDIIYCRCNANSLKDSVYAEMISRIDTHNLSGYKGTTSPCQIKTKTNTMYFAGIGGPDTGRTRSFQPGNPLSLIIVEEVQQLTNRDALEHALSSFTRYLDSSINSHIILIGNPPEFAPGTAKGWFWDYLVENEQNPNALVIRSSYKDVVKLLNKPMLDKIAFIKKVNYPLYSKLYLAEYDASDSLAVYNFVKSKHVLTTFPSDQHIVRMVIGIDVGVINDATQAVPIALTDKGYLIALPSYRYDPSKSGVKSIRQQALEIRNFLGNIFQKYNYNSYYFPTIATVDCAAPEMVLSLREFGVNAVAFTDKNTQGRIETNNNYFGGNMLYIIAEENNNYLIEELLTNTFIDGKLDGKIRNDAFDAFQYGLYYYYRAAKIQYKVLSPLRGE